MIVLVTDSETGGLQPKTHSILSIGIVIMNLDSGEILDTYESYVKYPSVSDYNITQKAIDVNRIANTPKEAACKCFEEGASIEEIQDKFMDMYVSYGCTMVGGHNIRFDLDFIAHQIFKMDYQTFMSSLGKNGHRYLDSMPVMRLLEGHNDVKVGASLAKSAASMGIEIKDKSKLHSALFDAIVTAKLLSKFRNLLMDLELK